MQLNSLEYVLVSVFGSAELEACIMTFMRSTGATRKEVTKPEKQAAIRSVVTEERAG